jgi:hypothetical protein
MQRFVGSLFHELAGIEHEDLVGLTHGGQPVRNDKSGSAANEITKACSLLGDVACAARDSETLCGTNSSLEGRN